MADGGGGAKWIKYGCLGCAGLVGLVVLLAGGLVGIAWMGAEEAQVEDRVLTHDVPPVSPAVGLNDLPAGRQLPASSGKIILDLANAEFEVLPGDPGEALRVEARFDQNAYLMEETFENPEGRPWEYTFRFRRKGSGMMAALRQLFSGSEPDVRIYLPPDAPIGLDMAVSKGGLQVRLGGLWLTEVDVRSQMGGLMLEFDEPLREPMDRLNIDVSMSGAALKNLGNGSPRELTVGASMGGIQVDLRGEWRNDSEITISSNRSGGQVRLPRDVSVEGLDSVDGFPETREVEVPRPTLRFTPQSHLKELDVSR